jgi:hypothetical protein
MLQTGTYFPQLPGSTTESTGDRRRGTLPTQRPTSPVRRPQERGNHRRLRDEAHGRRKRSLPEESHRGRRNVGFSKCLSVSTLARACNTDSAYIAKNRSIKVKTMIYTESERVEEEALLDSGTTECFIHPRFATKYNLSGQTLDKPRHI